MPSTWAEVNVRGKTCHSYLPTEVGKYFPMIQYCSPGHVSFLDVSPLPSQPSAQTGLKEQSDTPAEQMRSSHRINSHCNEIILKAPLVNFKEEKPPAKDFSHLHVPEKCCEPGWSSDLKGSG